MPFDGQSEAVSISSRDFWVKVVGMLQQNWALIECDDAGAWRIYVLTDTSGVFDELSFDDHDGARDALFRNGFRRLKDDPSLGFLQPPAAPFARHPHPNGPIYSPGRFWR